VRFFIHTHSVTKETLLRTFQLYGNGKEFSCGSIFQALAKITFRKFGLNERTSRVAHNISISHYFMKKKQHLQKGVSVLLHQQFSTSPTDKQ
jgi:hypothetical protein